MKELVSIIVPVYNAAAYIKDTIAMVQRQTFQEWELLLIEDRSPDDSAGEIRKTDGSEPYISADDCGEPGTLCREDVMKGSEQGSLSVEEFAAAGGQRVRLVCKEKNEGAARARNTGLDLAAGRYIAFLDADDIWHPRKLEKELEFMRSRQAGFVFTRADSDGTDQNAGGGE